MEKDTILTELQNVNIDSATAEKIADQYFMFKYIEMASTTMILIALVWVVVAGAKFLWRHRDKL